MPRRTTRFWAWLGFAAMAAALSVGCMNTEDPPAPIQPWPTAATRPPTGTHPGIVTAPPTVRPSRTGDGTAKPVSPQAQVDEHVRALRQGQVIYHAPNPMRVGESRRVTVRVADSGAPDPTSALPGSGSIRQSPVRVGSVMVADLSGPDFEISRVGNDDGRRSLATAGTVEWAWDVRPTRSGQQKLDLVLYVRTLDESPPLYYKTFDQPVYVDVNFAHGFARWVKEYGPLTGLTIPVLATAGWALWRRARHPGTPATPAA